MKEIVKHTDKLCINYLRKKVPAHVVEDVWEESRSIALVECLSNFKPELNKQFSTYYIWWVTKRLYMLTVYKNRVRRKTNGIVSLSLPLANRKGNTENLEDVLTNFNTNVKHFFKQCIKDEITKINVDIIKNS